MKPLHETASQVIARGGVVAFRTDTFYGLGVDPFNAVALQKLRDLKGREESKAILLLVSDLDQVDRFIASRSELFDRVAKRFWPGPITLVGVAREELPVELASGAGTIGVRLPNDERVRALVRNCGGALTATSANVSGSPPARTAGEVRSYFPNGVDLLVDDGEVSVTEPSSVLDLSADNPKLVREGAVSKKELELAIGIHLC